MARSAGRKSVAWGGSVLLLAALAATGPGASAEPDAPDRGEGAPEIRLEVPTSAAFDPQTEVADVGAPVADGTPADAPWRDLADFPEPVFDGRLGLVYAMGGNDGADPTDTMLWYRATVDEWSEADISIPDPRQAPAVGDLGEGQLVIAGGWDENGETTASTHYYDDGSMEWVYQWDDLPAGRAAAGVAAFGGGQVYVIGGCTTEECTPVADSVFVRNFWEDWRVAADYPVPVAYPACGAWGEHIYCTGGFDGTQGSSASYSYDRGSNTWSALPDAPATSWGTQHAMVDGVLVVNGGVQDGAVTNNTFGYDVRAGEWVELPNSNRAVYRGAGGCYDNLTTGEVQFMTVGGLDGTSEPVTHAQALPGFTACGDDFEVPVVARHGGADRYATAAAIAGLYAGPLDTVIVATGGDFPDALAASARAGSQQVPVLLTRPDQLPAATRAALESADPQHVIVIGGTSAVSDDVVDLIEEVSGTGSVQRLAGANRYETAAAIAAEVEAADTVFIATGANFPDGLAGGARAGSMDAPMLLVRTNALPAATAEQLERLSPESIVVLGGTSAISAQVAAELGEFGEVERIAGANRWETAALVAARYPAADLVGAASGRTWPDALTGAARAGSLDVPLMLVHTTRIPDPTRTALHRLAPDAVEVYGGTAAVSDGVVEALEALYD